MECCVHKLIKITYTILFTLLFLVSCAGNNGISYRTFVKQYGKESFYVINEPQGYMTDSEMPYGANLDMIRIYHNGDEDSFSSDYTVKYPVYDTRIREFIFHVYKDPNSQIASFEIDDGELLITVLYGIDGGWIGVYLYVNNLTVS